MNCRPSVSGSKLLLKSGNSARAELRRLAVPVSFIEEKMGMTFFPDVPEEVKTRIPVPEEWGF